MTVIPVRMVFPDLPYAGMTVLTEQKAMDTLRNRKFYLHTRKHFFLLVRVVKHWNKVAKRSCGVSIHGNVQNPAGCGPGQPAQTGGLSREV